MATPRSSYQADFPRFASPLELPPEDAAALDRALRNDDLVRGETRLDDLGIAIVARRRGSDALFLLRPGPGDMHVEPVRPTEMAAGPDQQRWMNYPESYEGLAILDAWRDGTTEDVMVLTGDLGGQVWRHGIDADGVELWRKTDDEAAIGAVHRERLFPGTLLAADAERVVPVSAPDPPVNLAADGSLLARTEAYVRAMAALRAAQENADGAPDVAAIHTRELHAALEALDAHVAASMVRPLIGRPDAAALARIEEPLRQELAAIRCIIIPPPRSAFLDPNEPPFELDAAADYPSVGYNIGEASTCLALRRPRAKRRLPLHEGAGKRHRTLRAPGRRGGPLWRAASATGRLSCGACTAPPTPVWYPRFRRWRRGTQALACREAGAGGQVHRRRGGTDLPGRARLHAQPDRDAMNAGYRTAPHMHCEDNPAPSPPLDSPTATPVSP